MTLKNDRELANTRHKLQLLEDEYRNTCNDMSEDARVRELSLYSLKELINQLKEEITRYEVINRRSARLISWGFYLRALMNFGFHRYLIPSSRIKFPPKIAFVSASDSSSDLIVSIPRLVAATSL